MESLFANIKIPKYVIVGLLVIIALMYISQAYHHYWSGKRAKLSYDNAVEEDV